MKAIKTGVLCMLICLFTGMVSSCEQTAKARMAAEIAVVNIGCPVDCGNGVVMTLMELDGSVLNTYYTFDDSMLPMETWREALNSPEVKREMYNAMMTASPEFKSMCNDAGVNVFKAIFTGQSSGESVEVYLGI